MMNHLNNTERTLAYSKAVELPVNELSQVSGGSNKTTYRTDRQATHTPEGWDEIAQVIWD